jgi:hypothetical protein
MTRESKLFNRVAKVVKSRGGDVSNVRIDDELVADLADRIVRYQVPSGATFPLTVDYGVTVGQMMRNAHVSSSDLTIDLYRFQHNNIGVVTVVAEVVDLDHWLSNEEVLRRLNERGLRAATMAELLAYANTGWNGSDFVAALGSVLTGEFGRHRGVSRVGWLYGRDYGRCVGLCEFGGGWDSRYRLLAVRK